MPKKLSDIQKKEISKRFIKGSCLEELAKDFNCSKIIITRYLKNDLSDEEFKELRKKNNKRKELTKDLDLNLKSKPNTENRLLEEESDKEELFSSSPFIEISPLNYNIDNSPQKDLTSKHISEVELPHIAYMVVDKKIELETKNLKDYVDWQFLSQDELSRTTIEIFSDVKIAKQFCNKDQKVIKVPNTNVFNIVAPFLISKGITRIVCSDTLIAL